MGKRRSPNRTPTNRSKAHKQSPFSTPASFFSRLAQRVVTPENAYRAGRFIGRNVGNYFRRRFHPSYTTTKSPGGRRHYKALLGVSTAKYKGRFNKPKKVKKLGLEGKALAEGYHVTGEIYGTVADPHCLVITHSTYHLVEMARVLIGAMLRKLLRKAGCTVNDHTIILPLSGHNQGTQGLTDAYFVQMVTMNQVTGVYTLNDYDLPTQATLDTLMAGFSDLYNHIAGYLAGAIDSVSLEKLCLYRRQTASDDLPEEITFTTLMAELDMRNEHITIFGSSEIKAQNRTKADTVTTTGTEPNQNAISDEYSADRVDNQPLVGKMYDFKHGEPRLKVIGGGATTGGNQTGTTLQNFSTIRRDGIKLTRTDDLGDDYREPPHPKHFANCSKVSNILLQPGDLKVTKIFWKDSGMFTNLMKRLRCQFYDVGSVTYLTHVPGKSQMIYLEEILRTSSNNHVTVAYEKEFRLGCFLRSKKPKFPMTTELVVPDAYNATS